jgi:mannose-6-phosphate isomerase-like protein (cupin superfamily)
MFTEKLNKAAKNVGFYETTIPPGSKVKNHFHSELDEVLYFLTGGEMIIESKKYHLSPGDSVILSPNTPHEIFSGNSEVKLIAVKLPNIVEDKIETD